ncbi:hypothetical protein H0H87_000120 [Tephrocybe sp. NHM501043]|nr:hypothetical protein H0H87_000120 [Tephrocybe sp. NHM501043]
MATPSNTRAVAVYCGSSMGRRQAHTNAALWRALAAQHRSLVYGGGMQGLMGLVSKAVLQGGGEVTGIIPYAMHAAGGERDKSTNPRPPPVHLEEFEAEKLIENGVNEGYIHPDNRKLIVFVDGPASPDEHETFDWGTAALDALDKWGGDDFKKIFNWTTRKDGSSAEALGAA